MRIRYSQIESSGSGDYQIQGRDQSIVRQEGWDAALAKDGSEAALSRSNATAFFALSESP